MGFKLQWNLDLMNHYYIIYITKSMVLTNDILQPGKITSKMYGTELDKTNLIITNTIQQPKRKIYPDT